MIFLDAMSGSYHPLIPSTSHFLRAPTSHFSTVKTFNALPSRCEVPITTV
jgi:hypothetical protein